MNHHQTFAVKRASLYALIGSICLSAVFGIWALLSGEFGWFQARILLTTVTISAASILGLACGACLEASPGKTLGLIGIGLTLLAAVMIIGGIWTESRAELYWKTAASISVFAFASAHLALLSMARLAETFRWSLGAAYGAILTVALFIVVIIWHEFRQENEWMLRLLGVAGIIDAAFSIMIPIFHRLSRREFAAATEPGTPSALAQLDREIADLRQRLGELESRRSTYFEKSNARL
jgi:hypothetical protein